MCRRNPDICWADLPVNPPRRDADVTWTRRDVNGRRVETAGGTR